MGFGAMYDIGNEFIEDRRRYGVVIAPEVKYQGGTEPRCLLCAFFSKKGNVCDNINVPCSASERHDHKNVYFVRIKSKSRQKGKRQNEKTRKIRNL